MARQKPLFGISDADAAAARSSSRKVLPDASSQSSAPPITKIPTKAEPPAETPWFFYSMTTGAVFLAAWGGWASTWSIKDDYTRACINGLVASQEPRIQKSIKEGHDDWIIFSSHAISACAQAEKSLQEQRLNQKKNWLLMITSFGFCVCAGSAIAARPRRRVEKPATPVA